jgi:ribonucleoside-diphosphate reductase alpha chain
MMAAAQPFLSGAISKTVNMPTESTVEDIEQAYIEGWKLGLKALAIYRDGSKQSQPLATSKEGDRKKGGRRSEVGGHDEVRGPVRRHLPETRNSITHKFSVGTHEGYITVGLFEDGTPGELFITMAKEGSTVGGLMDVIGTLTSMALQYGVPLKALVDKFSHMRFEPSGFTRNDDIPMAKSIPDYIFRWLAMQFIPGYREANAPRREPSSPKSSGGEGEAEEPGSSPAAAVHAVQDVLAAHNVPKTAVAEATATAVKAPQRKNLNGTANGHAHGNGQHAVQLLLDSSVFPQGLAVADDGPSVRSQQFSTFQSDAPACDNCGAITVRNGNCYLCHNCGASMGCS